MYNICLNLIPTTWHVVIEQTSASKESADDYLQHYSQRSFVIRIELIAFNGLHQSIVFIYARYWTHHLVRPSPSHFYPLTHLGCQSHTGRTHLLAISLSASILNTVIRSVSLYTRPSLLRLRLSTRTQIAKDTTIQQRQLTTTFARCFVFVLRALYPERFTELDQHSE